MKIGIIGTGSIAEGGHLPAINLSNNAELISIFSRKEESGMKFLTKNSLEKVKVFTDLKKFLSDPDLNLVIICSPDGLHMEHARVCIKEGKHVLIEKPMTTSISDSEYLINFSKINNVILTIGFHLRHHIGHISLLKKIQEENAIGDIRHIRAIWAWPQIDDSNWRARSEIAKWWSLSAIGSHCFDMVRWFSNDYDDWDSISPIISNSMWGGPNDESAVIAAKLKSGVTTEIVSSVQFGPYNRLEIFGSTGQAICQGTFGRTGEGSIWINDEKLEFKPVNPFYLALQDTISCIENNSTPKANGAIGLRSVKDLFSVI